MSKGERWLDIATIGVICVTVGLAGSVLWKQYIEPSWDRRDRSVADWSDYLVEAGETIDPVEPIIFVVWADYQCPACRSFHRRFSEVLADHSEGVEVIFRHWPLERHAGSYEAARAAECARSQGQFARMHSLLYETEEWMATPNDRTFNDLATGAGVPNLNEFQRCLSSSLPDALIEEDIAAVRQLGGRGTPTILFNNVRLGSPPSELDLRKMIEDAGEM